MSEEFMLRVLDSVIGVELDSSLTAEVRAAIVGQWTQLRVTGERAPDIRMRLRLPGPESETNGEIVQIVAASDESAADDLASELTLAGLRALAGKAFLFHAAGLAMDDGRVIAFVGPSGRGKTTLSRRLGMHFGYVSDETIAFRSDLSVIPYPKPLSIGSRPGVKQLHSPVELGLRPAPDALRLGALVLLDRDPSVTEPRLEAVPLTEALGELVPQMSSLARMPRPLHSLFEVIAASGGVRRLVYGGAEDLRELIPAILDTRAETAVVRALVTGKEPSRISPGTVTRSAYVDALLIDDQLAVLSTFHLHMLAGIGPALWRESNGVSIAQVQDQIESAYGPSPDGTTKSALREAVDRLVAEGVLQLG